ncbi:MAG: response regulator [Leptospiraceae bacterium]|nr:response regulator [Leptospiraceae bacterium]
MNILVIDSDQGLQEYYTNLMESEFQNVQITFRKTARQAMEYLPSHEVDVAITETAVGDMDIFEFIEQLRVRRIPVIVISADYTERLIVETLRAGALDFVSKNNIKLGLVPNIITRCLLEADRWTRIQEFSQSLPHREAWIKLNQRAREFLQIERQERERSNLQHRKEAADQVFIDGQSYYINYLYLQLLIPPETSRSMDERHYVEYVRRHLQRLIDIVPQHNGAVWTRKEDAAFFAFSEEEALSALLAALEMRSASRLAAFTNDSSGDPVQIRIGIAGSKTIYREDKGRIYSEGLNLAAHLALYGSQTDSVCITAGVYEQLNQRSRKYFFKAPQAFEGHTIYCFEYLA